MTTITITPTGIRETPCAIFDRHMFHMDCGMTIDGETVRAEWHDCMDTMTRMFPGVEFSEVWTGRTCTFTPTGRIIHIVIDPTCPIFADEVIE